MNEDQMKAKDRAAHAFEALSGSCNTKGELISTIYTLLHLSVVASRTIVGDEQIEEILHLCIEDKSTLPSMMVN